MSKKTAIWLAVLVFGLILPCAALYIWLAQPLRQQQAGRIDEPIPADPAYERLQAAMPDLDAVLNEAVLARDGESKNRLLTERVAKLGASLVQRMSRDAHFRFTVLADTKTARTISLPGGSIFLTEKLVRSLKDDPLAAMLAHEIGHVRTSLYITRMKSDPVMLEWLNARDGGKTDYQSAEIRRLLEPLLAERYTDEEEYDADTVATRLLDEAGRDPKILLSLPGLMASAGPGDMALAHPASPRRTAAIDDAGRKKDSDREYQLAYGAVSVIRDRLGGDADGDAAMKVRQLEGQLSVFTGTMEKLNFNFNSYVLADPGINAFVLPNGHLFMTQGLMKLLKSDAEVSAFWSHLIGHVVARHRMREMSEIAKGPEKTSADDPRIAKLAQLALETKYTPEEELEATAAGARTLMNRNLDPRLTPAVMEKVIKASAASANPAFAAAHPLPPNSGERIEAEIRKMYPKGMPGTIR